MTVLFIAGTPRSGGSAITSSFDNHPNVLVWPFHFKYFSFFRVVSNNQETTSVHALNNALLDVFRDVFSNIVMQRDLKLELEVNHDGIVEDHHLNVGGFVFEEFREELLTLVEQDIDVFDYLDWIFSAYQSANTDYSGKNVTYFLMTLTSARGLDWTNPEILEKHKIIFPYREEKYSYLSLKTRYFKKFPHYNLREAFSPFSEKGLLYWLEHYRQLANISENWLSHPNFIIVPFTELQSSPDKVLLSICSTLSLSWRDSMNNLSILGVPYGGNANQEDKNCGTISNEPSKPIAPLCSFEEMLFDQIKSFGNFGNKKSDRKIDIRKSLLLAYRSAFYETDDQHINRGNKNRLLHKLTGRLSIFLSFVVIRLLLFHPHLIRKILRRNNPHMNEMSFWD